MKMPVWRRNGLAVAMLLGALFVFSMYLLTVNRFSDIPGIHVFGMGVSICGMGLCVMLLLTLLMDNRVNLGTVYFLVMVVMNFFTLFFNDLYCIYIGNQSYTWLIMVTQYINTSTFALILLAFWLYLGYIIGLKRRLYLRLEKIEFVLFFVFLILLLINLPTGWLFTVTMDANVEYTDLGVVMLLVVFAILVVGLVGVYSLVTGLRKKLALSIFLILPMAPLVYDVTVSQVGIVYFSICIDLLIIYGNFYVSRSKELVIKDAELMEQRAKILISQIQPHFLYNSLTSIMNIKGNPPATREAISDFGLYLRGNLDTLKKSGPIPIRVEMDHVETYIMLEKLDFGDRLIYETDLMTPDILIPAQTLQILVTDCIDYGLRPKGGGTIRIASRRTSTQNEITVSDDGVPFDLSMLMGSTPGQSEGVGFNSVRKRVEDTVGGNIVLSFEGGNIFTITIPVQKKSRTWWFGGGTE